MQDTIPPTAITTPEPAPLPPINSFTKSSSDPTTTPDASSKDNTDVVVTDSLQIATNNTQDTQPHATNNEHITNTEQQEDTTKISPTHYIDANNTQNNKDTAREATDPGEIEVEVFNPNETTKGEEPPIIAPLPPSAGPPLASPIPLAVSLPINAQLPAPSSSLQPPARTSLNSSAPMPTLQPPITSANTPTVQQMTPEISESDKPERQPYSMAGSSSKNWRRFSSFVEPPMPAEHKKDRLRHHVKLAHKKNTLGETIYKGHPSWLLMRDIQTGLFTNIKNMAQRTVEYDLFHTPPVTMLPIAAPNAKFTFKFKDYCPMAFFNLREHFGINHVDYVTSLCQNWNEVGTPGKSGSLFFFSLDNQYVLKTIPKREAKILRELLPTYYKHMTTNTNSLLTRFMGLHRVKPHKGRQVRFLVMGNLFNSNLRVHMRFDLKGSTVGRELSAAERTKKNPTYKDLDFRRLNRRLHLGPNRDVMLKQLQADTDYLSSQHIMDYSLLVGIHFLQQEEQGEDEEEEEEYDEPRTPPLNRSTSHLPPYVPDTEIRPPNSALSIFEREDGGVRARSPDGTVLDEHYYIGVIDILMHYSLRKQFEHAAKRIVHPRGEISSVDPASFATRFMKFAVESID